MARGHADIGDTAGIKGWPGMAASHRQAAARVQFSLHLFKLSTTEFVLLFTAPGPCRTWRCFHSIRLRVYLMVESMAGCLRDTLHSRGLQLR